MSTIPLPAPRYEGSLSLERALKERRSVRRFRPDPLTLEELSQLLWATQGLSQGRFRTAPSAGATYPLELLAVVGEGGVVGLSAGIYDYQVREHALALRREGEHRPQVSRACLGERFVLAAPTSLVLAALFSRTTGYYGGRGERYVHLEVGHAAQNLHLQAVALGLGSVPVGAFDDGELAVALGLSSGLEPLYLISVGRPR